MKFTQTATLTLLLVAVTSLSVVEASSLKSRRKRQGGAYNWGLDIFNNIKNSFGDIFGQDVTTTTSTTRPPTAAGAAAATVTRLSNIQCQAALAQCSLVDIMKAQMGTAWQQQQEEATREAVEREVNKVRTHYRTMLSQLKAVFISLVDAALQDSAITSFHDVCQFLNVDSEQTTPSPAIVSTNPNKVFPRTTRQAPQTAKPAATTTTTAAAEITTTPMPVEEVTTTTSKEPTPSMSTVKTNDERVAMRQRCLVGDWSTWSAPLGFGTQERKRVILVPGVVCPEAASLVEHTQVDFGTTPEPGTSSSDSGNPMDNVKLVSDNFHNDFIRVNEGKPRDLLLVLDSSGSITDDDFNAMKDGLKQLIDALCGGFGPAPTQNRLSIVQFSTAAYVKLYFKTSIDTAELHQALDNLKPLYGYTCTSSALTLAYKVFQEIFGSRTYSTHDTLIITDGQSNCGGDLAAASSMLQERSNVYALGIGLSSLQGAAQEITSLVSNENPHHLFSLANFQDFKTMAQTVRNRKDSSQCQPIVINN